jgi:tetratricopeptide (TPR) repeat protein
LTKAIKLYRRILSLKPDFAECHNNLGVALDDLGRLEEAAAAYRRAITLKPDYAEAHSNLGNALAGLGRLDDALGAYRNAVALNPGLAEAWNNLAYALRNKGVLDASETACRRAIALRPDFPQAHVNLGNALRRLGRLDEAETILRRAIMLEPDKAEIHSDLGVVLVDLGRADEAEAAFRRAIALDPDLAGAYNNLGIVLQQAGRLTEAGHAAERAVALAPRTPAYFLNLGHVRQYAAGDPYMTALETLARDEASLGIDDRIRLHFALAKAYADTDRPDDEFRRLLAGNALKRSCVAYDEAAVFGRMDRVQAVFTPELVRARQGAGQPSPIPVFIVGMPRSGTTLVEQILASHPEVFGGGELNLFERAMRGGLRDSSEFPDNARHVSGDDLYALGARYLAEITRLAPTASRITDKMPSNFLLAGLIHLALPNATIIHVVRDPIDTCVSNFSKLFAEPQNYSYDLAELGRYYRRYQALMAHWHHILPAGRILNVIYENLVGNLDGTAQSVVAHCGLPWDDRCLDFHRTERSVRTASAPHVRQPIYGSSIGRWRLHAAFLAPLRAALSGGS